MDPNLLQSISWQLPGIESFASALSELGGGGEGELWTKKPSLAFSLFISVHRRCPPCGNSKGQSGISSNRVMFHTCTKTFRFLCIHPLIACASRWVNFYSNSRSSLKVNATLKPDTQPTGFPLFNLAYCYYFKILLPWDCMYRFSVKQYQRLRWCYLPINNLLTGA